MQRTIKLAELPVVEDLDKKIEISVGYNKGGPNMFTGGYLKRGYYLHVTPVTSRDGIRTMPAFTGIQALVEESARFSWKVFEQLVARGKALPHYDECLQHVLAKNNLTLQTPENDQNSPPPAPVGGAVSGA